MNPVGTEVGNLGFITEGVATFVTSAPSSRVFPFQIQDWTLVRTIRNRHFITPQRSPAPCTIFQSLLRLVASCTIHAPFFRCYLPCCCFFPSKAELYMLCIMPLLSKVSSMISIHRIHRRVGIVRLIHNWAAYLAALPLPLQLPPSRVERCGLTPLHSVPTNLLSPLRAARLIFSKKSHKTASFNARLCHSFLENCYV